MADQEEHPNQTRLALAALAACIAKTLGESDLSFVPRLEKHLEAAYYSFRDTTPVNIGVMETLNWTREILRGE
ncbi:MAG: hypothetical protein ACSLFJ_04925 [Immundisolibacter sp.]|uniref:hypothetical protein n=1 Tax=Immundisolibacter sp. TaxID=1934948 RepID=UPI003EE2CB61